MADTVDQIQFASKTIIDLSTLLSNVTLTNGSNYAIQSLGKGVVRFAVQTTLPSGSDSMIVINNNEIRFFSFSTGDVVYIYSNASLPLIQVYLKG
jgi:hypothetical protein